jgi:hypothetical protein
MEKIGSVESRGFKDKEAESLKVKVRGQGYRIFERGCA